MRRPALFALFVIACPFLAGAQHADRDSSRVSVVYGVHYGLPMRLSLSLGAALGTNRSQTTGFLGMLEQGQQGSELSAGWFKTIGRYGSGVSIRGAVLRTAGEPWEANPHTTYAGGEVHWMVFLGVGGRAGLMRRVSSNVDGTHDNLVTLGVSLGQ
jgi:hypothetical protein